MVALSLTSKLSTQTTDVQVKQLLLLIPLNHLLDSHLHPSSFLSMDQLMSFEALLFPSDGRHPHMVALTTSPALMPDPLAPYSGLPMRLPHPEVYMDYIAEGLGSRAWSYQVRMIDPTLTPVLTFTQISSWRHWTA